MNIYVHTIDTFVKCSKFYNTYTYKTFLRNLYIIEYTQYFLMIDILYISGIILSSKV